ncbi:MAG: RNA polymerase sigma factor [Thermomicrobiales bacterium]
MAIEVHAMGQPSQPNARDRTPFDSDTIHDDVLVQRAQAGDTHAFDTLYRRYIQEIHTFVASRVDGNTAMADDITSDVFTKVFRFLNRYTAHSFQAWLYQIARNAVIDHYRRQRPVAPLDDVYEITSPAIALDEHAIAQEARANLLSALATLSPVPRRILELRLKGYGLNEICSDLEMELSAMKSAQHRAFKKLRVHLHDAATEQGDRS